MVFPFQLGAVCIAAGSRWKPGMLSNYRLPYIGKQGRRLLQVALFTTPFLNCLYRFSPSILGQALNNELFGLENQSNNVCFKNWSQV